MTVKITEKTAIDTTMFIEKMSEQGDNFDFRRFEDVEDNDGKILGCKGYLVDKNTGKFVKVFTPGSIFGPFMNQVLISCQDEDENGEIKWRNNWIEKDDLMFDHINMFFIL